MKVFKLMMLLLLAAMSPMMAQDTVVLDDYRHMCIAGKGPGQDAAINPYLGQSSVAIVENMGESPFDVRIQVKGQIVKTIKSSPARVLEIKLDKDQVMYFDSDARAVARVSFKKALD